MEKFILTLKGAWLVLRKVASFVSRHEQAIVTQTERVVATAEKRAAEFAESMGDEVKREKAEKTGAKVVHFVRVSVEWVKNITSTLVVVDDFSQIFA